MAVYYYKKKKEYSVFKDNKKIASYSYGGYGKYAKKLAKLTDETGIKYKNYYKIDNKNKIIKIIIYSKKHSYRTVLVDLELFDKIKDIRWSIVKGKNKHVYYCKGVISKKPYKNILLHRHILNYNGDLQIDHLNKDGLDNRLCNLRIVNQSMNQRNIKCRGCGIWINVTFENNRYRASCTDFNGKRVTKSYNCNKLSKEMALKKAIWKSIKMRYKYGYILTEDDINFIKENKLFLIRCK